LALRTPTQEEEEAVGEDKVVTGRLFVANFTELGLFAGPMEAEALPSSNRGCTKPRLFMVLP